MRGASRRQRREMQLVIYLFIYLFGIAFSLLLLFYYSLPPSETDAKKALENDTLKKNSFVYYGEVRLLFCCCSLLEFSCLSPLLLLLPSCFREQSFSVFLFFVDICTTNIYSLSSFAHHHHYHYYLLSDAKAH